MAAAPTSPSLYVVEDPGLPGPELTFPDDPVNGGRLNVWTGEEVMAWPLAPTPGTPVLGALAETPLACCRWVGVAAGECVPWRIKVLPSQFSKGYLDDAINSQFFQQGLVAVRQSTGRHIRLVNVVARRAGQIPLVPDPVLLDGHLPPALQN